MLYKFGNILIASSTNIEEVKTALKKIRENNTIIDKILLGEENLLNEYIFVFGSKHILPPIEEYNKTYGLISLLVKNIFELYLPEDRTMFISSISVDVGKWDGVVFSIEDNGNNKWVKI